MILSSNLQICTYLEMLTLVCWCFQDVLDVWCSWALGVTLHANGCEIIGLTLCIRDKMDGGICSEFVSSYAVWIGAHPSKVHLLRAEGENPDFMLHLLVLKSACGSHQSPLEVSEELQRQSYESRCHLVRCKERIYREEKASVKKTILVDSSLMSLQQARVYFCWGSSHILSLDKLFLLLLT